MIDCQEEMPADEPTVYVIDDVPAVRQAIRWLVESEGRRVADFDSAELFLEHYAPDRPGCVLTDVRMPGMGGVRLLETLRGQDNQIPVIVMTAHNDMQAAVRAMKAGALDFIEKPYNDEALLELIEIAIKDDRKYRLEKIEQDAVVAKYRLLTPREQQVMALVVQGNSNKDIALALKIRAKTVEAHRAKVMEKMAANSVAELTTLALSCL